MKSEGDRASMDHVKVLLAYFPQSTSITFTEALSVILLNTKRTNELHWGISGCCISNQNTSTFHQYVCPRPLRFLNLYGTAIRDTTKTPSLRRVIDVAREHPLRLSQ